MYIIIYTLFHPHAVDRQLFTLVHPGSGCSGVVNIQRYNTDMVIDVPDGEREKPLQLYSRWNNANQQFHINLVI